MTQVHDLSALEQARAIRNGEFTSREITEHYLERTEALADTVGAFVTVSADQALDQAEHADRTLTRMKLAGMAENLPALFGVVCPMKDLHFARGIRARLGSAVYDVVPEEDSYAAARMRQAGLIFTGSTNSSEFGLPCYTENAVAPPARTPWDRTRSAGGSSGGAAAAVATGLAPIAMGSDGGGSIRIPASVCGLVGIKPTRGRVSMGPMRDPVGELPVLGPLARTVADAAALLEAMGGPYPGDPFPVPDPESGFLEACQRQPSRLRVGRYATPVIADTDLDPEVLAAFEEASELLRDLGHEVVDIDRPFGPEVVPQFETVWSVLALLTPVPAGRDQDLMPLTRWLRDRGAEVSGLDLATAVTTMRMLAGQAIESTTEFDAILTPTLAKIPAPVGGLRNDRDPAADFQAQKEFTPFTSPYNVTGQPALSVPVCWTDSGLPIGVQLVGRPFDEATIISLAAQMERAQPWIKRRHDLW